VAQSHVPSAFHITRRRFLTAGLGAAAGLALYSGEIARHLIDVTYPEVRIPNLPAAFDGFRIAQVSDIHFEQYTEPFFLRMAIDHVNRLRPDAVFLTGDFITHEFLPRTFSVHAMWRCARVLKSIECPQRYAVLGNHDAIVSPLAVTMALTASNITVLRNEFCPLQRSGSRVWLSGLDDVIEGHPDIDRALPDTIRNRPDEPVLLMCHEPDYVDNLLAHPAGESVALMLSGHTHGGQIRFPFVGPMVIPDMGKKYVEGLFRLQNLQLYVNRGLGTVGVPFRLNCPPEITLLTLRRA
jgi:hypothetical protein